MLKIHSYCKSFHHLLAEFTRREFGKGKWLWLNNSGGLWLKLGMVMVMVVAEVGQDWMN